MMSDDAQRSAENSAARPSLRVLFLFLSLAAAGSAKAQDAPTNPLGNPPGIVDHLFVFDGLDAFSAGICDGTKIEKSPTAKIALDDPKERFPKRGSWTSAEIAAPFPFTEALPSYNPMCPEDTGLRFEMRVRPVGGTDWSAWYDFGTWGRIAANPRAKTSDDFGIVKIDTLLLRKPAEALQVRATLSSCRWDDLRPAFLRAAVVVSGIVDDPEKRKSLVPPIVLKGKSWVRNLDVPFRPQGDAPKEISSEICSPTSVGMVLAYYGENRPTLDHAVGIFDLENGIFGNWMRAVAWAGQCGMTARIERMRSWDAVKQKIAAGVPLVASINFKRGEFPSAISEETTGHLIVIRGFTPEGDVIVNDPASRAKGNGAVYKADELARAWFDKGGVAYVIEKLKSR